MLKRIQTLYLDTSVIGGYYDGEFEEETVILFEKIKLGQYNVVLSNITYDELQNAPVRVKAVLEDIPQDRLKKIELTKEATELADSYIIANVVGKTSRADCFHIAMATIYRADILVSWNFKHIVNVNRIRGYNAINLQLGYSPIDIRSPKEIIYDEN